MARPLKELYFTIDLRSLALFRILFGLVLISDWLTRWPDLEAFYTSFGFLPVEAPLPKAGGTFHFSLLDGFISLPMVQVAFCLGLLCYVLLVLGYRTKCFQVLSFLFLVSVLNRNTVISHGADQVLVTMMMWSLFLPVGKRFSVDAVLAGLRRDAGDPGTIMQSPDKVQTLSAPSLAAFAIVCQIALIYGLTALDKHGDEWLNGTALYYTLHLDQFATPLGKWLLGQPLSVLRLLTWGTLALEFAVVPLILLPFAQPLLRRLAIVSLTGLHLGTWLTMELGCFPFVMISSYPLLLQPEDWAGVRRWSGAWLGRTCWFARSRERLFKWLGMATIPALDSSAPATFCPLLRAWRRTLRTLANAAAALVFLSILVDSYNRNLAGHVGLVRIPEPVLARAIIQCPGLIQDWHLFAPYPMKDDGWWVIDGVTESGERFDPLTGTTPTFEKPAQLAGRFDPFWRMYLYRLWLRNYAPYRLYFGKYVTRKNHREKPPGQRLVSFRFYYVLETTLPPGSPQPFPTERRLLYEHECFARETSVSAGGRIEE